HVVGLGLRAEGLARDPERGLDPFEAVDPGVMLVDQLEVDPGRSRLEAFQGGQLPLGGQADVLGDLHASAGEAQIHPFGTPRSGWARVRLTWSLSPHSPAGALARSPGRPRQPNSRPLPVPRGRSYI